MDWISRTFADIVNSVVERDHLVSIYLILLAKYEF